MILKQCDYCGKAFRAQRVTGRYCSSQCVHNSWVSRHGARWREYNAQWRKEHPNYWREYYRDGRGKAVETRRQAAHSLERKARSAISNALRLGKIAKPELCDMCGEKAKLEAHHWHGYDRAHWLDVQWLCHEDHLMVELIA